MRFDDAKKLHQRKFREATGRFLVEGEHSILELQRAAADNPGLLDSTLFVSREHADWRSPFQTQVLTASQMVQLSDTRTPQGMVAVVPILPAAPPRNAEQAAYFHEVQDPGNLGTILRTLAWFGGFRCLLSPGSVDPYNSKVVRASTGAVLRVPIEREVDWPALRARFTRFACLDMQGEAIRAPDFRTFECYLFGNEARGLPDAELGVTARRFSIPGAASIESLNLASAVNICLYELRR